MKTKAILIIIICLIICYIIWLSGYNTCKALSKPVGLAVIRPDTTFFECAKAVHGNYRFYYEPFTHSFMFERAGEICHVNTMQFKERYIKLYGRSNEVFVEEK